MVKQTFKMQKKDKNKGQFPKWILVRLSSLVVKCFGCCTDVVGSIPGPDTCDRQRLGHELHWWHYSQKCVGLVCPPQLPSPAKINNKTSTRKIANKGKDKYFLH